VIPPLPEMPTPAEINKAKAWLLDELLGDFPFTGEAERAHLVAAILLPFVRELIDGPTPLHLIEKPSPGTGATLLAAVATEIATGGQFSALTEGRDEDEWRKRITAKLSSAPQTVVLDNIRRRLESAALSSVITQQMWEDRKLGQTEWLHLPVRCVWVATGNNPAVSGEIARRTVRIRLDAKEDRPWLRKNFRHPALLEWAAEHRGELIWAVITLVRAWLAAGRPLSSVRLGMFEAWAGVIGGILEAVKISGFLANLEEFYERTDTEGIVWRAFVAAWWEKHREQEVGVAELWTVACPVDGEPLDLGLGDGSERSQRTRLGYRLGQMRDRQFEGKRIVQGKRYQGAQLWKLEAKSEPEQPW
jgi:hypothetical protein